MSSINNVTLTGRLVSDPEADETPNGAAVCKIRLAVDGGGQGRPQDAPAGYFEVVSYGPGAAAANKELTKGYLVGVEGRLEFSEWGEGDSYRSKVRILGQITFLAPPRSKSDAETSEAEAEVASA